MSSHESKTTENHDTIKAWVEEREGKPALVEGVVDKENAGQMLRIHFPGHATESLDDISWELFFELFEENNFKFLYQDETTDGDRSKFCEFIKKK